MIRWILFIISLLLITLSSQGAVEYSTKMNNPGFKTVKQLAKMPYKMRVRYFKNLPKAFVEFEKMQTTLRPDLFGKATKKKRKKSKYGFVISLLNEAQASAVAPNGLTYWDRGYGDYYSNSCNYGGNISSYNLDPDLGPYGCLRPKGKTKDEMKCHAQGGAPCNAVIFGIGGCAKGANRPRATSYCADNQKKRVGKLAEQFGGNKKQAQDFLESQRKNASTWAQQIRDGKFTANQIARDINSLFIQYPGLKYDPEMMAHLVILADEIRNNGGTLPPSLSYMDDYDMTVQGTLAELQKMSDHCNSPLNRQVIDKAAGNRDKDARLKRQWEAIKKEMNADRHPIVGKTIQKSSCNQLAKSAKVMARVLDSNLNFKFWREPFKYQFDEEPAPAPIVAQPDPVKPVPDPVKPEPPKEDSNKICNSVPSDQDKRLAPNFMLCAACMGEYAGRKSNDSGIANEYNKPEAEVSSKWLSMLYLVDRSCPRGQRKMDKLKKLKMEKVLLALEDYGHCTKSTYDWKEGELDDATMGEIEKWKTYGVYKGNNKKNEQKFADIFGATLDQMKGALCGGGVDLQAAYDEAGTFKVKVRDPTSRIKKTMNIPIKEPERSKALARLKELNHDYEISKSEQRKIDTVEAFVSSGIHACMKQAKTLLASAAEDREKLDESELPDWDQPRTFGSWATKVGVPSQYACAFGAPLTGFEIVRNEKDDIDEIVSPYSDLSTKYGAALEIPQIYFNKSTRDCMVADTVKDEETLKVSEAWKAGRSWDDFDHVTIPGALCGDKRTTAKNGRRRDRIDNMIAKKSTGAGDSQGTR